MKKKFSIKNVFSGKATRYGSSMAAVIAVVIVVVVVLNVLVGQIPVNITEIDNTKAGLYTIGDETLELLDGLTEDIDVYIVNASGSLGSMITRLLRHYAAYSPRINVQQVDLSEDTDFLAQYAASGLTAGSSNSIVVESPLRNIVVNSSEIYKEDYTYYLYNGTVDYYYDGEYAVSSAIYHVSVPVLPKVYTVSGHGETEIALATLQAVNKNNIITEDLNLAASAAIPDDASCVVINAPTQDITAAETSSLTAYLEGGGDLLLLTGYTGTEMPNLMSVMENWGVYADSNLIMEGDASRCIYEGIPYLFYSEQYAEDGTAEAYILASMAHSIGISDSVRSSVTIESLFATSDLAFMTAPNGGEAEDGTTSFQRLEDAPAGPYNIGVAITEDDTNIAWFSCAHMLNEEIDSMVNSNNTLMFINTVVGICEVDDPLTIASKSLAAETLTHTGISSSIWMIVVTIILPLATLAAGFVIWLRRRKK